MSLANIFLDHNGAFNSNQLYRFVFVLLAVVVIIWMLITQGPSLEMFWSVLGASFGESGMRIWTRGQDKKLELKKLQSDQPKD